MLRAITEHPKKFLDSFPARLALTFLSSCLLVAAFPQYHFYFTVWIALIPLFFLLDNVSGGRQAFGWSYAAGIVFFIGTVFWIGYVTVLGAGLLILYLAVYFGIFGWVYHLCRRQSLTRRMLIMSSAWSVLEWIRGHAFSGFDWASLSQSQYLNTLVIQIADLTGMYGVSFMIVMANVVTKEIIQSVLFRKALDRTAVATAAGIFIFIFGYGSWQLQRVEPASGSLKVAVIQANIEQERKWDTEQWPLIMDEYKVLTREAAWMNPDLIIWPETSFPGFLWIDQDLFEDLQSFVQSIQTPLLFGSVVEEDTDAYYNGALLLDARGQLANQYNKTHLVPFGEYVPLRSLFPTVAEWIPIADFSSGTETTVFTLDEKKTETRPKKFSVLICFEDTLAGLARPFVRNGADFLVNITNDAWFQDTKAPFMHVQSAVFRSVENRRPMVRAANTGVSAFIDAKGRIVKYVEDGNGKKTFISGVAVYDLTLTDGNMTFYTKYGDIFLYLCIIYIILNLIIFTLGRIAAKM